HHFVVPLPLAAAQIAAAFVPEQRAVHLHGQAERYLPVAREVLAALAEADDAELVRVEERDQRVSIRKEGGLVRVEVQEHGQTVDVQVPIAAVMSMLPEDGRLTASQAVRALQHARLTQVVDVQGGDGQRVKVT